MRLRRIITVKVCMKLVIGNKNYSSWSMRPWVLMRELGLVFEEVNLRFDSFDADSQFKQSLDQLGVAGKVPVLIDPNVIIAGKPLAVWDTLAIIERLAECFPDRGIWPRDESQRAIARSIVAEIHSGFNALRSLCPMNIEADLQDVGADLYAKHAGLRDDLARIESIWAQNLANSKGPMLFGALSAVDAYFAPTIMRIQSYGLPINATSRAYANRILALKSVQQWVADAISEDDFLSFEEPYRSRDI